MILCRDGIIKVEEGGAFNKHAQKRISSGTLFGKLYEIGYVRFEVFTAVTMKNGVFWDVTPRGSCKNRRFGGT
jgi:hypothetical protein